jgi:hypothetical protein
MMEARNSGVLRKVLMLIAACFVSFPIQANKSLRETRLKMAVQVEGEKSANRSDVIRLFLGGDMAVLEGREFDPHAQLKKEGFEFVQKQKYGFWHEVYSALSEIVGRESNTLEIIPLGALSYSSNWKDTKEQLLSMADELGFSESRIGTNHKPLKIFTDDHANYLVDRLIFSRPIPLALVSPDEKQLVKCNWIKFSRNGSKIKAELAIWLTSYPKTKWKFTSRLLDSESKELTIASQIVENNGSIIGFPFHSEERLNFVFDKVDIAKKARSFELKIKQISSETSMEVAGELLSAKLKDKWLLDSRQSIDRNSSRSGIYLDIKYIGIPELSQMLDEDIVISHRVKSLKMGDIPIDMNDLAGEVSISNKTGFGRSFLPEQIEGLKNLKPGKYPVTLVLEGDIYKANNPDQPLEHWQVELQEEIELNDLIFEKEIPKAHAKVDYDVQVKANINQIGERGVRFSIWFDKLVWNLNETPTFLADLSHRGESELHVIDSYMLEYDEVIYVVRQDSNNDWPNDYRRDADYRDITFELDNRWVNSQSGQELKLTSGLHRVRLSFNAKVLAASEERFVRIVSDTAEFRILEQGKQITEEDVLETAIGGMPGQKYTEEEVKAMHFEKYGEKLSYDELAKFYCDKTQETPNAELAECALAFKQDDINYLHLYMILGQAYHSQLKKYSPVLWSRQRRIVARVYLAGLNYALGLDLPLNRPGRIQVFKYYDNNKEIPIGHFPTAAIKVAEDVDRVRDLIQQRQALIGQIITIYAREPDAFKELRELVPFPVSKFRTLHMLRPLSSENDDKISNLPNRSHEHDCAN